MLKSPGNHNHFLPLCVGRVANEAASRTGSCFPVDRYRVLTSWHVVRQADAVVQVTWPALDERHDARVELAKPEYDIAILRLSSPTQALVLEFNRVSLPTKFVTFGYRHGETFEGLFSEGTVLGSIRPAREDGPPMLQLQSMSIDRGMSGAPVVVHEGGRWVIGGMVAGLWQSTRGRDQDLAFALTVEAMEATTLAPGRAAEATPQDLQLLNSVLYLASDRYHDGAWGRSFMPREGAFSEDARTPGVHTGKRALSITAWAGTALLRLFGSSAHGYVSESRDFVMQTYLATSGAFGHLYKVASPMPFVEPIETELGNPRHTASALSFLLELDGPSRLLARALSYLLRTSDEDGGWGEGLTRLPNTLATAYVLDSLTKSVEKWPQFASFFEPHESDNVLEMAEQRIEEGLHWLARRQQPDGSWSYLATGQDSPFVPAYSAHVLAFAPQVLAASTRVAARVEQFLSRQIDAVGGVPKEVGSTDIATPSLMIAWGLRRADPTYWELASSLADAGAAALETGVYNSVATMGHIFLILYLAECAPQPAESPMHDELLRIIRAQVSSPRLPDREAAELEASYVRLKDDVGSRLRALRRGV